MATITAPYIDVSQSGGKFVLTKMTAGTLTKISYVAVRGQSEEEGAIQRILNSRRIASIKEFTLAGGSFPSAIILNWISDENKLNRNGGRLAFADADDSAQIIDGQHRLAGIRAAITEDKEIAKLDLPVAIYEKLGTQECADIFLSINTEQKPVPRSLVFDLYGEASEHIIDPAAVRARDIAIYLNETEGSPYHGEIKLPGDAPRKGGVALSTVVSAVKSLVEEKGIFEQIEVKELEMQRQIIFNLFHALKQKYGDQWETKNNVFMYAAGFVAAMEFLKLKLIPYCNNNGSFTVKTIVDALSLKAPALILQEDVKGMGGKDAPKYVYDKLVTAFKAKAKSAASFEI